MRLRFRLLLIPFVLVAFIVSAQLRADTNPDWTTPVIPFRVADGLYYVGSRDLASYLVTTPAGNIVLNANLESSVPQIRASVERLGFRWADTKILLLSHAHFDHAAGSAAVLRQTGARLMVMDGDVSAMESGGKTQYGSGLPLFPAAHVARVLHDGDTVHLGGVTLTAHKTAGHTRGCTSWTMQVHEPGQRGGRPLQVVIIGSWSVLDSYRLVAAPGKPASYPGIAQDFEHTFAALARLPCDIFLGAHGQSFDMLGKLARMPREGERVWIDPEGYRQAVAAGKAAFETRMREESR